MTAESIKSVNRDQCAQHLPRIFFYFYVMCIGAPYFQIQSGTNHMKILWFYSVL